jgi:2-octaprenyl-6-methoxyphenol hydroxylase
VCDLLTLDNRHHHADSASGTVQTDRPFMTDSPEEAVIDCTVAIVGGGMGGLTLACALGSAGVPVVIIDRDPPQSQLSPVYDGRTTAIAYGSAQVLRSAGVWPGLVDQAGPILDIRVTDQNDPLFLHYDHREVGDQPFGWIVENRLLRQALLRRLSALPTVRHIAPRLVTGISRSSNNASLTLETGQSVTARLIVGADGRNSLVRESAGIDTTSWSYPQHAIVTTLQHSEPHGGVAVELFLPAGPFAMLPMTGNRMSIVWTERAEQAEWYVKLPEARFLEELRLRVGDWLGDFTTVGPRGRWPLGLMVAERAIDRRLALISEASHAMHPIAGQGFNVGVRDVAALAEAVVDAWRLGLDPGGSDVLEHYQRWRRVDMMTLLAATDLLNRLFSNDLAPLAAARRLGMAAINGLPPLRPLKKLFMRHAMGVVGDLPRMVRGEAL